MSLVFNFCITSSTPFHVGFQDSYIRVWSLTPQSLRSIKAAPELALLDKEADDILDRMMDEKTAAESRFVCLLILACEVLSQFM